MLRTQNIIPALRRRAATFTTVRGLEVVRMTELIDQSLTPLRLLHDSLLVVLSQGPGELVVVHGRTVLIVRDRMLEDHISCLSQSHLSLSPQSGDLDRINNLEDSLGSVDPVNVVAIQRRLQKKFLDELPEMDVCSRP